MQRMADRLGLTEVQTEEIDKILRENATAMREQFAQGAERPTREQMETHRSEVLSQLSAVLDEEQAASVARMMDQRMTPPRARDEGRPIAPGIDRPANSDRQPGTGI